MLIDPQFILQRYVDERRQVGGRCPAPEWTETGDVPGFQEESRIAPSPDRPNQTQAEQEPCRTRAVPNKNHTETGKGTTSVVPQSARYRPGFSRRGWLVSPCLTDAAKACPERSRRAAQECSPQPALSLSKGRKPWDAKRKNDQAAERRKIIAQDFSPGVRHTKWNQVPEGRHKSPSASLVIPTNGRNLLPLHSIPRTQTNNCQLCSRSKLQLRARLGKMKQ
jgi:hypothetical protein